MNSWPRPRWSVPRGVVYVVAAARVVKQYERGVVLRLGSWGGIGPRPDSP